MQNQESSCSEGTSDLPAGICECVVGASVPKHHRGALSAPVAGQTMRESSGLDDFHVTGLLGLTDRALIRRFVTDVSVTAGAADPISGFFTTFLTGLKLI